MTQITLETYFEKLELNKFEKIKEDVEMMNIILNYLEKNGKTRCMDIAELTNTTTQYITALMRKLALMGLVKRETEEGTPFKQKIHHKRKKIIDGELYRSERSHWEDVEITPTIAYYSLIN